MAARQIGVAKLIEYEPSAVRWLKKNAQKERTLGANRAVDPFARAYRVWLACPTAAAGPCELRSEIMLTPPLHGGARDE